MKAHQAYHIETLHLVAGNIYHLVEFIIIIQKFRRIILDIELLKLDVCIEILNDLLGGNVTGILEKLAFDCDTEEPGFLNKLVIDERNAAALLGKDIYDLGFG